MGRKKKPLHLSCYECGIYFTTDEKINKEIGCGLLAHIWCFTGDWKCGCPIINTIQTSLRLHLHHYFGEKYKVSCSEMKIENTQLKEDLSEKKKELNIKKIKIRTLQDEAEKSQNLIKELEALQCDQLREMRIELDQQLKRNMEMFDKLEKVLNEDECDISVELSEAPEISTELNEDSTKLEDSLSIYKSMTDEEIVSEKSFEGLSPDLYRKCIIIRDVVMDDTSPIDYILNLASIIELPMKVTDIDKTFLLQGFKNQENDPPNENTSLLVIFTSLNIKLIFLLKKDQLKINQDTQQLDIQDYISHETRDIFNFCKLLQGVVFKHVTCKNNEVYVRKTDESEPINIDSKKHAEHLLEWSIA